MLQYLIRHGESVSNASGRVQGQEDVELSDTGREQAIAVASWGRSLLEAADAPPVDELWSSPLRRARETAEAIAAATGLPLRIDDELRELHAGIFQGHLWADLEARFPEAVAQCGICDAAFAIHGGESRAQLAARGRAA
ncbi:MAG: histidine phosphatase family protein, partial [Planctomycetaceae bacterium]